MAPKTTIPAARPIPAGNLKPTTTAPPKPPTTGNPKPTTTSNPKPTTTGPPKPNASQPTPQKLVHRGVPRSVPAGPGQAQKNCNHTSVRPRKSKASGALRKAKPSGNQATQGSASHGHVTSNSSSGTPASSSPSRNPTSGTAQGPRKPVPDNRSRGEERKDKGAPKLGGSEHSLVKIVVYISGGTPDYFFNRHVKAHFTSPQAPNMHETIHARTVEGLWEVVREHHRTEIQLVQSTRFLKRMDPVWVLVKRGQETVPADIFASVNVANQEPTWNCQNFLLDGFKKLAQSGYKTLEWYDAFETEMLDMIDEGSDEW